MSRRRGDHPSKASEGAVNARSSMMSEAAQRGSRQRRLWRPAGSPRRRRRLKILTGLVGGRDGGVGERRDGPRMSTTSCRRLPQMLARQGSRGAAIARRASTAAKGSLSYTFWCKFMTQEEARIHCETVIATASRSRSRASGEPKGAAPSATTATTGMPTRRRTGSQLGRGLSEANGSFERRRRRRARWDGGHGVDASATEEHAHNCDGGAAGSHGNPRTSRRTSTEKTSLQSAMLNSTYEDFMEIMAERNIGHKKQLKYQDQWVQLHRSCQPGCACECQVEGVPALEQRRRYEERLAGGAAAPAAAPTASLQALSLSDLSGRGLSLRPPGRSYPAPSSSRRTSATTSRRPASRRRASSRIAGCPAAALIEPFCPIVCVCCVDECRAWKLTHHPALPA